jgi:hypothetical protein
MNAKFDENRNKEEGTSNLCLPVMIFFFSFSSRSLIASQMTLPSNIIHIRES